VQDKPNWLKTRAN